MKKETKTHLAHGIEKTENFSQYDESIKVLLSDKQVLARIAKHRTEEFRDYDIQAIMESIEGEPEISKRIVYPGKRHMEAITGMNSESKDANEGEVTFDIRFYMVTKDEDRIKVIVNVEAQKAYHVGYHFEPRAIVYCARMISEQIDREFTTDNYDGLKKVYSIWIFFDAPVKDSDTITEYTIEKKDVYGVPVECAKYDYLSISFIRLPKGNMEESKNKLIHMLSTLFSQKLDADAKKKILEQEHQMKMTRKLEGGIHSMCNVAEGLWERAVESGLEHGIQQGIEQGIQQGIQQERQRNIDVLIRNLRKFGVEEEVILAQLMEEYELDEETANSYL